MVSVMTIRDDANIHVGNSGITDVFGFSSLRNGMKFTAPRLKSFLKSRIDWFIASAFVVPHQLYEALMSAAVLVRLMLPRV